MIRVRDNRARPLELSETERRFCELVTQLKALHREFNGRPPADVLAYLKGELAAVRQRMAGEDAAKR